MIVNDAVESWICYFGSQVNHNGHLTFDTPWFMYIPQRIPRHRSRDLIAPFWTDLDNRVQGQVSYHQYTSGTVLQQATHDINSYFPGLHFSANWVFVATWSNVQYFPTTGTVSHFVLNGRIHLTFNYIHYDNHNQNIFRDQRSKQSWSLEVATHLCLWTMG